MGAVSGGCIRGLCQGAVSGGCIRGGVSGGCIRGAVSGGDRRRTSSAGNALLLVELHVGFLHQEQAIH